MLKFIEKHRDVFIVTPTKKSNKLNENYARLVTSKDKYTWKHYISSCIDHIQNKLLSPKISQV